MTATFRALFALAALATPCCARDPHPPRLAIYYSFDHAPAATLLAEMREEFARIAEPAGISVEWRDGNSPAGGDFADIFTVRFHGSCSISTSPGKEQPLTPSERNLAETSIADGRVLPFADVQCDLVRRYLNPSLGGRPNAPSLLARAIARVTAHELYHMMTGLVTHCQRGISQAEYSREDLMCTQFLFGKDEAQALRARF